MWCCRCTWKSSHENSVADKTECHHRSPKEKEEDEKGRNRENFNQTTKGKRWGCLTRPSHEHDWSHLKSKDGRAYTWITWRRLFKLRTSSAVAMSSHSCLSGWVVLWACHPNFQILMLIFSSIVPKEKPPKAEAWFETPNFHPLFGHHCAVSGRRQLTWDSCGQKMSQNVADFLGWVPQNTQNPKQSKSLTSYMWQAKPFTCSVPFLSKCTYVLVEDCHM